MNEAYVFTIILIIVAVIAVVAFIVGVIAKYKENKDKRKQKESICQQASYHILRRRHSIDEQKRTGL